MGLGSQAPDGPLQKGEGNGKGQEKYRESLEKADDSALYTGIPAGHIPWAYALRNFPPLEIDMRNTAKSNLLVPEIREVMDIRQASDYLGISPDTLYKYASEAFIPAFKLGNRWRFKRSRLDEWMDRQSDAVTAQAEPEVGAKTRKPVKAAY